VSPPPSLPGIRELLGPSARLFREVLARAFLYGLTVQILTHAALGPCAGWAYYKAIAASGRPAVTNYEMVRLLLSGEGALLAILWGLLGTGLFLLGAGGMIVITTAQAEGRRVTPWRAFRTALSAVPLLADRGLLKLVLAAAVFVPVTTKLGFALSSIFFLPFQKDLLHEFLPVRTGARAGVILVLAAAFVAFHVLLNRWLFALHGVFIERRSLNDSIKESVRLGRGQRGRLLGITLAVHLGSAAILSGISALFGLFSWALILALGGGGSHASLRAAGLVLLGGLFSVSLTAPVLGAWAAAVLTRLDRAAREIGAGSGSRPPLPDAGAPEPEVPLPLFGRLALGGLFLFALVASLAHSLGRLQEARREALHPVLVTAHRGSSGRAPENTVRSILAAIEDEANYAEIDVTQSKDGELVVFHDASLRRVTGLDRPVWELTFDELRRLDAGGRFRAEFRGEQIPTLREVLGAARGKIRMNIEIKVHGHGHEHQIAEQTVSIIREEGFLDQCIITSLDYATLLEVRALTRAIPVGLIVSAVVGDLLKLELDFYSVQPALATPDFIRQAHALERPVHVWTINDESYMEIMIDRGVDSVITNEPVRARSLVVGRTERQEREGFVARLLAQ
jgi:glycerophosphoryl diester phosphodiesterase